MELNPWLYMGDEDLKKFLTDPMNDENAPDRKLVIDYIRTNYLNLVKIKEGDRKLEFLDVGSGTGNMYLTLKNSDMGFYYCGVDKTSNMIEFARKRFPDATFMQADIHKLPCPDRSCPVVYCRHVLEHLPGYEEALAELARVCDNYLIVCLLNPLADKQQIKVVGKPPSQTKPGDFSEHYLNTYPRVPFMQRLKNLGFDVVVDERVEVSGYFKEYELIIARRIQQEEQAEQDRAAEEARMAGEAEAKAKWSERQREEEEAKAREEEQRQMVGP